MQHLTEKFKKKTNARRKLTSLDMFRSRTAATNGGKVLQRMLMTLWALY
jgi:hypothetical protein